MECGRYWFGKKTRTQGFQEAEIDLMKVIKKSFDPNNIMNPGKIL